MNVKAACFDFDRPIAPASFKDGIDFERLFSPVRNPLPLVKATHAFSTQAPKRAGSFAGSGGPSECMADTSALFSVTSFGGAERRRR